MRLVYDALIMNPRAASESLIAWTIASAMAEKYPVTVITPMERAEALPQDLPFDVLPVKYGLGKLPLNGGLEYTYRVYSENVAAAIAKTWTPDTIVHRLNPMGIRYGNRYTGLFDKTVIGPLGRSTWPPGFPKGPTDWLTERIKDTDIVRLSLRGSLLRRTYEDASVILVSTNTVRECLPESVWAKCVLQPDGVDVGRFVATPLARTDTPSILFVGRLLRWKGLGYLLRALRECTDLRWRLVVAGDGVERFRMERLASELGIRDRVEFAGWVPHARMRELYAACTFCCFPAVNESTGNANLEAMASGRAVIAADWAGPRAAVGSECGLLAEPRQYHLRLAEALRRLIEDVDMCERLGLAGRRLVERRNDWPVVLGNLEAIYQGLWNGEPRPAAWPEWDFGVQ
jgi:glycosyltransferase involved in cell wall biosynthesis